AKQRWCALYDRIPKALTMDRVWSNKMLSIYPTNYSNSRWITKLVFFILFISLYLISLFLFYFYFVLFYFILIYFVYSISYAMTIGIILRSSFNNDTDAALLVSCQFTCKNPTGHLHGIVTIDSVILL